MRWTWSGPVQGRDRDGGYTGQSEYGAPGRRKGGRPQRFMDVMKEGVQRAGVAEEDAK